MSFLFIYFCYEKNNDGNVVVVFFFFGVKRTMTTRGAIVGLFWCGLGGACENMTSNMLHALFIVIFFLLHIIVIIFFFLL